MASKRDKLLYIESLTSEEILKLIPHNVMNKLVLETRSVRAYLDTVPDGQTIRSSSATASSHSNLNVLGTSQAESGKTMRPLNAFIAFRSKC